MKKKYFLFLLISTIGFLSSCNQDFDSGLDFSNSENNGNESAGEKAIFSAKIGDEEFVANTTTAVVTDDYVLIAGTRSSKGDLIQIILPSNKVGTYTWAENQENAEKFVLAYVQGVDGHAFVSASNEDAAFLGVQNYTDTAIIKITGVNKTKKTISGTFQFTGFSDTEDGSTAIKVITKGNFENIPYTDDIPAEDSDDVLKAKIDGVDYINDKVDVSSVIASGSNPYYSIVGKNNNDNSSVGLMINKSYSVGTYEASSNLSVEEGELVNVIGASYRTNDLLYNSKSGSLTITSKTAEKMEGTFNFVVHNFTTDDEKTITGSFSIDIKI